VATATSGTNAGPTFSSRVLTDGTSTSGSGRAYQFSTTITGSYLGVLPEHAVNPTLTLNITQISIYGVRTSANASNMAFEETTSGHASNSGSNTLKTAGFTGGGRRTGNQLDPDALGPDRLRRGRPGPRLAGRSNWDTSTVWATLSVAM
jgi:hypothetical protein